MNRTEVQRALEDIDVARDTWSEAHTDFTVNVDRIMRRLIHEAIANRMSADDVARLSGYTVKRVRDLMRTYGLDPKGGKQMLSRTAAEALANNAELLGIEPREMDLMSPLAYLPAGSELRRAMAAQGVSKVTEVSGNDEAEALWLHIESLRAEYEEKAANPSARFVRASDVLDALPVRGTL